MLKELTVKASIQLPVDPFDAAAVLTRAEPIIKQVAELMATISGASVCTTFDGRSAIKGAAPVKRTRKPRAAIPAPEGVAAGPPNGEAGSLV